MADTASNTKFKVENGLFVQGSANLESDAYVIGPVVVTNTAAFGNTTVTGFINVSSTANVGGDTTLRGTLTVNGAVTIANTVAAGNTTITGFANISTTANVGGNTTLRGTLTVNGAVTIANTIATGNTSITGFVNVSSTANVGGNTTLRGTLTVNGAVIVANTIAIGNTTIAGFANITATAATFNANTGVANTTEFITTTAAHGFSDGDLVQYIVATGNTAVTGLANGSNYFVISSNSTAFKLSSTYGGAALNLTAGVSETGHTLTPQRIRLSTTGNIDTSLGQANVASLRVLNTAVVNGAVTFANTLSVTGATTLSSTLAAGNTTVTGFANISSTLAAGNTTVTGFANISSTLAAGNTTITGFANVSSTLNVTEAATVNGATTINNTLAAGNTTVTGFANVSSTLAAGNTTITGFADVSSTLAAGNTTITGFINVSSNANIGGVLATGNTTVTGFVNVSTDLTVSGSVESNLVPSSDATRALGNSTYRWILFASNGVFSQNVSISHTAILANATVSDTLIPTANGKTLGTTTARWNITANNEETLTSRVTANTWFLGSNVTFNANTGVANATEVITTSSSHGLVNGDVVQYVVSAGNTAVTGLTNATLYFVINAAASNLQLSTSYNGSAINVTAGVSETGHTLVPIKIAISNTGTLFAPVATVNVGTLRTLSGAILDGTTNIGNVNITGSVHTVAGNVTFDTDLLFLDAVNNRIGLKNNSPSSADLVTIGGNVVFNAVNTGLRVTTSNASHNAAITLSGNATNTRLTFATYDNSNSSVKDGGFVFNGVNSTATQSLLAFNTVEFLYKSSNVVHSGNFGIYNVSGTRVGP